MTADMHVGNWDHQRIWGQHKEAKYQPEEIREIGGQFVEKYIDGREQ
jgi:hypothetical protein